METQLSETTPIIFRSLDDGTCYSSVLAFIDRHRRLLKLQKQNISFVGIEDVQYPLPALIVDGQRIQRYILHMLSDTDISLKPLVDFLDRKRAWWIISSIFLYNKQNPSQYLIGFKPEQIIRELSSTKYSYLTFAQTPDIVIG